MRAYRQAKSLKQHTTPEAKPEATPEAVILEVEAPRDADLSKAIGEALTPIIAGIGNNIPAGLTDTLDGLNSRVTQLETKAPPTIRIKRTDRPDQEIPAATHKAYPVIRMLLEAGYNVLTVGPAGSGKTHLAAQIAKDMDLEFGATSALLQKYELLGYKTADGKYESTLFRDLYETNKEDPEKGALFLWDEIDASAPEALVAFNMALENGKADFPDGNVTRRKVWVSIAGANTFGNGADMLYVGRNPIDAATKDRFAVVLMDYDEDLETYLALDQAGIQYDMPARSYRLHSYTDEDYKAYVSDVQQWRKAITTLGVRHIISPRATIRGIDMMANWGMSRKQVEESFVWKGLDAATVRKIKTAAKEATKESEA